MARDPLKRTRPAARDGAEPETARRRSQRDAGGRMQRVRIGVVGLASVFLLTMLATAVYSLLGDDTPAPSTVANVAASAETNAAGAPKEPLAELGVTPGNIPPTADNGAAPAPARAPVVPPGH